MTPVTLRAATSADLPRIKEIIQQAKIYPFDIHWHRFVVAESGGIIVGTVQLKRHRGNAEELASLAVIPERQNEGIAAQLIEAVLAKASGPVYLDCHVSRGKFYERFGFRRLGWRELPLDFKMIRLFLLLLTPITYFATKGNFEILIMKHDPAT